MEFSAFADFGHLEFSSDPPIAERIYKSLRDGMGGDEALGEDTFEGPMSAKLYAMAMGLASIQRSIDHVNQEARPGRSEELLTVHETDYKVTPPVSATHDDRRAALATKVEAAKGCTPNVVDEALEDLLGSHLVAVRRFNENDYTAYPADWDTTGPGLWKNPETAAAAKTHWLATLILPGTVEFTVTEFSGTALVGGDTAIVDPGKLGIEESITVLSDGSGNLSAVFQYVHEIGALITTAPWPRAATTSRRLLVVTDATVARSRAWRKRIAAVLSPMLRAVDCWSVVEEYSSGQLGPFYPNEGLSNITPIVQTTTAEA